MRWDVLMVVAICTGMWCGELLNATWRDVDFQRRTIDVSLTKNTEYVWECHIKDTDRPAFGRARLHCRLRH